MITSRELEMQQLEIAIQRTEASICAHQQTIYRLAEKKAAQAAEIRFQKLLHKLEIRNQQKAKL